MAVPAATTVGRLVATYADIQPGEICALFGSTDHLELAANAGSAADRLQLARGGCRGEVGRGSRQVQITPCTSARSRTVVRRVRPLMLLLAQQHLAGVVLQQERIRHDQAVEHPDDVAVRQRCFAPPAPG